MADQPKKYSVVFSGAELDKMRIGQAYDLLSIRVNISEEDFQNLGMSVPMTHFMYTEGKSYENYTTTIMAGDVISASGDVSVHADIIRGLHTREGLPVPDEETIRSGALNLNNLSVRTVDFLLNLHTLWFDPANDCGNFDEILDMVQEQGLGLDDFYRDVSNSRRFTEEEFQTMLDKGIISPDEGAVLEDGFIMVPVKRQDQEPQPETETPNEGCASDGA